MTNIIFDFPFSKKVCAAKNICGSTDLNGWFNYDNKQTYINLGSDEIKGKSENSIIKWFILIDTHECLHKEIYDITNQQANDVEEKYIELMTGERRWQK